jgi:hypothetical protein
MKEFKERLRRNSEFFTSQEEASKMNDCDAFIDGLAELLRGKYEMTPSCNRDLSRYLIPKGTKDQISYYGKPEMSFRASDHWNWYTSLAKCSNERMIQCYSMNLPGPRPRINPGEATKGVHAYQVAIYQNGRYYAVYGDVYDRKERRWGWIENTPESVIREYNL